MAQDTSISIPNLALFNVDATQSEISPSGSSSASKLIDLFPYIDEEVAMLFLGNDLRDTVKTEGYVKCCSSISSDKWLKAVSDPRGQSDIHVSSLKRCVAACAYWLLDKHLGSETLLNPTSVNQLPQIEHGDKMINNSLADAYEFPKGTDLYYLYNIGLDLMVEVAPVQATALLGWRYFHRAVIFGPASKNNKIEEEVRRCVVHYKLQAAKTNLSLRDYRQRLAHQMTGYKALLETIIPVKRVRGTRKAEMGYELAMAMEKYFSPMLKKQEED